MTTENTTDATITPDTIVLVHGLWVTPRSWERWIERYEGKGCPYFEYVIAFIGLLQNRAGAATSSLSTTGSPADPTPPGRPSA